MTINLDRSYTSPRPPKRHLLLQAQALFLFACLAVGLVRLPVRQLACLPTVPRLLASRALLEPCAAAAGVEAVRLGLQVIRLRDRSPGGSGGVDRGAPDC
jgi:hypothetical protein